ncbi:SDR family NAD(P)-dependent oxidoreductase, partial [Roseovarius sp. S1116L3]|uniref:SDR family NAD(P)-dependent oxidoreductase n=1 Tax=Roseovarius roseus TaxID=3342636 RepID=UPI003B66B8CE
MSDLALVTGGAAGIGAAIAQRLTEDGLRVIVLDRAPVTHDFAHEEITVDLADVAATQAELARVIGDRRVTRLVNNAGVVMPATLEDTKPTDLDAVAAVNLRAPIICMQAVLPGMKAARMGRVVNRVYGLQRFIFGNFNLMAGVSHIPLLALGIPGDVVTAVILGAFMLQGLTPGPLMFQDNISLIYAIFIGIMLSSIVLFGAGKFAIRYFARIADVPRH